MPNYPKNPVFNSPSGQKIPASWHNRRTPFDDNRADENRHSKTGYGSQDTAESTEASVEQAHKDEALDDNPDRANESQSMPDAEAPVQIDK